MLWLSVYTQVSYLYEMTRQEALARLDEMVMEATRGCGVDCTRAITESVVAWCRWMGAVRVTCESLRPYTRTRADGSTRHVAKGRVDVVAGWKSGERLSIEIDSWHKTQSAEKLRLEQAEGSKVLWIRWDDRNRVEGTAPEGITTHWTKIAEPRHVRHVPDWVKERWIRDRKARRQRS